jgi:hypothetical protein
VEEKPPQQKPNGTMHLRVQQDVKTNWVLTGDGSPQSDFGIQKSRFECVHAGIANLSSTSVLNKDQERRSEQSDRRFCFGAR